MQIQINTDNHIDADKTMLAEIRAEIEGTLGRFEERLTRVEVHLTDVNANKGGIDIRCVIEARPSGMNPVKVDNMAADLDRATRGAADKMVRALDTRFGRKGR